ncbi:ABC transporter ATP-binding protein [Paenibacillus glycinis]|uniref:ATP-binding cassette domain-containing protein n=1 Tax=Paenibacillus glycinis TaxID=2697035 RepID=A0ABW9XTS2_9BACL|nr:ABC transporter ATP-binding protein [Paenibacillus glycinis]NBD26053.1 ATP-binding cassette domain-containing protein [Paenibacillus glycinis]
MPAESPNAQPLLQAVNVKKVFGRGDNAVTAVKNIDLNIRQGSMIALKGRSGSGKTTLLNLLAALDQPTEGRVFYEGRVISELPEKQRSTWRRTNLGLVFQAFGLIPLMSAYENVEFGLRIAGSDPALHKERAEQALEWVGMKGRMKHRPPELSGGEQQRVAIARAIAHRPALLLADEPTAELDSRMGLQVIKVFRDLVEDLGMTIVMTTHDPGIMEIVDHVIALEDGEIVVEPNV